MALDLKARLDLDGTGYLATLKRAESAAKSFAGSATGSIASSLTAAAAGAALAAGTREVIDYAGRIHDLSIGLGVSAENLQVFDYAAKQNGATLEDMTAALRKLAAAREDALKNPSGDKAKAFAQFGIGAADLAGADPAALMFKLSEAVKGAEVDLNTLPVVFDLIGKNGTAAFTVIQSGIGEARAELQGFNGIMSNETVAALDEVGDRLSRAFVRLRPIMAEVVLGLARVIDGLSFAFSQVPKAFEVVFTQVMASAEGRLAGLLSRLGLKSAASALGASAAANKTKNLDASTELLLRFDEFQKRSDPAEIARKKAEAARNRIAPPEPANREGQSRLAQEAAETLRLQERILKLRRDAEFRDLSPDQQTARLHEELDTLRREREFIGREGSSQLENLRLDAAIAEKEDALSRIRPSDTLRPAIDREQFDSLARVGGFAQGANQSYAGLWERIARSTETTARNTAEPLRLGF